MKYRNCKTSQKYCDFTIIGEDDGHQREMCVFCKRQVSYRKVDGRVQNKRYLFDHIRDFCQASGATKSVYYEIYGEDHVAKRGKAIESRLSRAERIKELDQEKEQYLRYALNKADLTYRPNGPR